MLIEGFGDAGQCVAHHEGFAVFVKNVAPGDVVDLSAVKRKNYFEAVPLKFHKWSEDRTAPRCKHFGTCGGCKWQHVNYPTQLAQKQQIVEDNLQRIAKVDLPAIDRIIGSPEAFYYRNKLEFTFSNRRWLTREEIDSGKDFAESALGFHVPKLFDRIVDIDECHLQPDPSNQIKNSIRSYAIENGLSFYDIKAKNGFLRNLIVRNTSTGELMVIVQVGEENESLFPLLDFLGSSFPQITSLLYVINKKGNETFHDLELHTYNGRDFIWEEMPDYRGDRKLKFRIGPKSFFQTNTHQAETLYRKALDFAELKGKETVYDLYTGTGTIALYAASSAQKIVGIEYVEAAVEDARINARENVVENTTFVAGDMKDVLDEEFISTHGQPDVIITDPPRAGMHKEVVQKLLELSAPKIVYISCNPATQARDLAILDQQYEVKKVQPVDMFPHTSHIESVVLLELK